MDASVLAAADQSRDSYGFEVKKEYQKLHRKYAPLWEKEEEERTHRWLGFLSSFQGGSEAVTGNGTHTDAEAALEAALLHLEGSGADREDMPWWQQLRTLVQAGVPMSLRGRLWKTFLRTHTLQQPGAYDALVSQALAPQFQNSTKLGHPSPLLEPAHLRGASEGVDHDSQQPVQRSESVPANAAEPVQVSQGRNQDWNVQIEKDLHRTFPGHPVMDRSGRRSLRRILAAYACRNSSVGYCQGMNFVAGCLLLFMDEEDAFWCLTTIIEDLLPGYFSTTMVAPQVDQLVFKQLVDKQFPRLTAHLDSLGVNVASVSTQWFLCVFVNSLPLETCLRVWDLFLFERCSSVLFRVALALVDIYAQALVTTVDSIDAFSLLQNMAPLSFDSSRLVDVACIAYAYVDSHHMEALRAGFEAAVHAQVQERLDHAKSEAEKYEAENGRKGKGEGEAAEPSPVFKTFLPRIQVASPRSIKAAAFKYSWPEPEAPLQPTQSKAAATAYKIASSPAVAAGPAAATAAGSSDACDAIVEEDDTAADGAEDTLASAGNGPDLGHEIQEVLDRRKQGLLQAGGMGEEERAGVVSQLMALVARLEEELFQSEARRFEAENAASTLVARIDGLQTDLQLRRESAAVMRATLASLNDRHESEAVGVLESTRRCLQYKTALQSAQAHRALRASLLTEKKELIANLQQELGQVSARGRSRLLQKLGFQAKG